MPESCPWRTIISILEAYSSQLLCHTSVATFVCTQHSSLLLQRQKLVLCCPKTCIKLSIVACKPWIQVRLVPSQHQGDALNDLRGYIKQYVSSFIFLGAAFQLNPISLPHSSLKHVHKHTWFITASLQAVKRNHSDTFILLHASNMKLSQSMLCSKPSEIRSCGWGCGHLQEHWASKAWPAPV